MGGVRRRAKQCFATRLPHPCTLPVERPVLQGPGRAEHRPAPGRDSDAPGYRWRRIILRSRAERL